MNLKTSFVILLTIMFTCPAFASFKDQYRCCQLQPNIVHPFAVDFALPKDFVAKEHPERPTTLFLGPKKVLDAFFDDPESLTQPIVALAFSFSMTESTLVEHDVIANMQKELEEGENVEIVSLRSFSWGSYPGLSVDATYDSVPTQHIYVGQNTPEGSTMIFSLIRPKQDKKPSKKEMAFWKRFIDKTKQLPPLDLIRVNGQDLHEGYTMVDLRGSECKISAAFSEAENAIQISVIPQSDDIDCIFDQVSAGLLGLEWHQGEPIVKLCSTITRSTKGCTDVCYSILTVLMDEVATLADVKHESDSHTYVIKLDEALSEDWVCCSSQDPRAPSGCLSQNKLSN